MNGNNSRKLFKMLASFVGIAGITALLSFPASAQITSRARSPETNRITRSGRLYSQATTNGTRSYEFRSPRLAQRTGYRERTSGRSTRGGYYRSARGRAVRALW